MAYLRGFGAFVPERIVGNAEIAARVGKTPEWILEISGISERRWAGPDVTVADMAVAAAEDCLTRSGVAASAVGMLMVASGSAERRFPGPAAVVALRLGLTAGVPAIDLPMASVGSLYGMALASRLAGEFGTVLVIGAEKMSAVVDREPADPNTAILFGDGAGACVVSNEGRLKILGSVLHSDGTFAEDLRLGFDGILQMNGMAVILQAGRKIPAAIHEVLTQHGMPPASVERFVMHQANQNLIVRVARSVGVPAERFYSNIGRLGNTSSASMLLAAAECWTEARSICFAAFGAGFHWGALLAVQED